MAVFVRAAEPEIFAGYGKTRWGQTIDEVKAIYPRMTEVSRYRELKKVPLDSSAAEDASGYPVDQFFSSPAPEPLQEMVFGFVDGKLYLVEIAFSAQACARLGDLALARMVWEKYFTPDDAREHLNKSPMVLHVITTRPGLNNLTDRPQQPEQLFYPNMYQYGKFDLGVYYRDETTSSRAFDEAAKRKQAVEDRHLKETERAADELGVRDLL